MTNLETLKELIGKEMSICDLTNGVPNGFTDPMDNLTIQEILENEEFSTWIGDEEEVYQVCFEVIEKKEDLLETVVKAYEVVTL